MPPVVAVPPHEGEPSRAAAGLAIVAAVLLVLGTALAGAPRLADSWDRGVAWRSAEADPTNPGGTAAMDRQVAAGTEVQPAQQPTDDTFTLGELLQGEVSAERFNAFWDARLAEIEGAPCPDRVGAPGSTAVRMFVGATPPAHLDGGYTDWSPLLQDAYGRLDDRCR